MYNKIHYIYWAKEAIKETIDEETMKNMINYFSLTRRPVTSKTKRSDFTDETYKIDKHGDYYELYFYDKGKYYIFSTNSVDHNKNEKQTILRADRLFDAKFKELNGTTLRRAFGFMDAGLKRCIPKQFYYKNSKIIDKTVIASSIDASSQYPSGCLGRLPDAHTAILVKGRVAPSEEYPFAFYASGHCAEYKVFDTHNWLDSKFRFCLFRLDKNDDYPFRPLADDKEETILMKASEYTMDDTWNYFYNIKNSLDKDTEEYKQAKLVMNKTIGCWHRKDKDKKRIMSYDDHGSYQMAHIAAIAIARGNQKILDKVDEIGILRIAHICVDGIVYLGSDKQGIDETKFGQFAQEFTDCDFTLRDYNVYIATKDNKCIKFKHGGYDLLYGDDIDESRNFTIEDLYNLSSKERIGDIING